MIESRLIRMFDSLKAEIGEEAFNRIDKNDLYDMIRDQGQAITSSFSKKASP
jgi:type I restriction enzyme M protein